MRYIVSVFIIFSSIVYGKIDVVASIVPQQTIIKAIAQDMANISVMVKPGNSPHTYEPKPSQMRYIANADIYFSIGVEFEHSWLKKFANQNRKMKIVDISKGITKIHHNPHIWLSIPFLKIMAKNILDTFVEIDSVNTIYYKANYTKFINMLNNLDKKIKLILKDSYNSKFMVFHPSWGYFAKDYNLVQIPIEIDGKKPKPRTIIKIIKKAKKYNVKAIITAPEFSSLVAKQIAKELKIKVVSLSPLEPNIEQNLLTLAKIVANK